MDLGAKSLCSNGQKDRTRYRRHALACKSGTESIHCPQIAAAAIDTDDNRSSLVVRMRTRWRSTASKTPSRYQAALALLIAEFSEEESCNAATLEKPSVDAAEVECR